MATNAYLNGTQLIAGSSQTNPQYANYQGSQTYAPRSVPQQQQYLNGGVAPYIGTGNSSPAPSTQQYAPDVNAGSDPTHLTSDGIDFGSNKGAYDAYVAQRSLAPQIDAEYGAVMSNLDDRRNNILSGEQDYYNSATQGYDAQKPILQQGLDQGNALIGSQRNDNSVQEQNALAAARRVYNELRQGVQQRFGGGGPDTTGGFANEFYGREFARNMGNTQNTAGQNSQKLNDQAQTLLGNYNAQLQKLEGDKQAALSSAKDAFRQRLDQIDAMKGQALENKAAMKLQELQNLRAQAAQIEAQNVQFQQQLQLQQQAALQGLSQNVNSFGQTANRSTSTNSYSNPAYSALGGGQATTISNNISGSYDPYKKNY